MKSLLKKEIRKIEDLVLTEKEKKIIENFPLEMMGDKIAVIPLDVKPTESKVIMLENAPDNNNKNHSSKATTMLEAYPIDPMFAIVVATGPGYRDTTGTRETKVKKGDLVLLDKGNSGAQQACLEEYLIFVVSDLQINARWKNLLD